MKHTQERSDFNPVREDCHETHTQERSDFNPVRED
jgi:hypothetical protein